MKYFISFRCLIGFENCVIDTTEPISSLDQIRDIEEKISRGGYVQPHVISFAKLEQQFTPTLSWSNILYPGPIIKHKFHPPYHKPRGTHAH